MFAFSTPEKSDAIHAEMLEIEKELYSELGLHYRYESLVDLQFRVLDMPVDDLGAPAIRKFDIEAWMPSKEKFGEISSTSNCTDFQSRRLNIRYRNENKQNLFVHTVNGTACAVPRIIISIMENFQNSDGSIDIPKCLHPFMLGGISKIGPKKK
jgi:seryl-tRNA synthetase